MVGNVELAPRPTAELQPLGQRRRLLHHLHRVGEQDSGLFAFRRGGVNLGSGLSVGRHTEEANAPR
jgi:hypothetical protein